MFMQRTVTPQQKHGIIVCLPKHTGAQTPEEYRPITLLNTDYTILARIMTDRLRPLLEDHLLSTQLCSVTRRQPALKLDFQNAFDRISHKYLFQIMQCYGITPWFIELYGPLYTNATVSVQINGSMAGHIPIQCAVR
jgi:hypothetical protein